MNKKHELSELIRRSIKTSVNKYPKVIPMLSGSARWAADIYTCKVGEAPDDDIRRKDERRLARALTAFFDRQLDRILKEVRNEYKDLQISFWEDELQKMWEDLSGDFVGVVIHGAQAAIDLLPSWAGQLIDEVLIKESLIDYAREYRDKWLRYINETSRGFVDKAIRNWTTSGDPLDELINTLSDPDRGIFTKTRAELIATTEVTRLNAEGNALAWRQLDFVNSYRWNTVNDKLVCDICDPKNGEIYPLATIESEMPAHPRCRCWATPIVEA